MYDGQTFEHGGRTFTFKTERDDDMGPPWKEHDGHGPVTDWVSRDPDPGERLLHEDRGSKRYYNFAEAMRIAARDGWAAPSKRGRKPSSEYHATRKAVLKDFEYLRAWCNDEWEWTGVIVTHPESGLTASLWGIDGDHDGYLETVARELADQINHQLDEVMAVEIAASRPDMHPEFRP